MKRRRYRGQAAIDGLRFLIKGPARRRYGFHPEAATAARAALRLIASLRREVREYQLGRLPLVRIRATPVEG